MRILQPIWEGHLDGTLPVATSLPLVAKVDAFATDAYPDAMPDQLVFHSGAAQGEPCAIYTQSVDGQYWSEERVRIPAQDSERAIVNRYQVVATVKTSAGMPLPGVDITVTADDPVDFEVQGSIYRTGPNTEARVTTDLTGRIIIRTLPSGLAMPRLHLSVVGVSQSATVNPAASIHQFLGGDGVLPNHGDGFTAEAVLKATNPDGSYVFPGVARTTDDIGPTADELVKSCQLAFAVDRGQLPTWAQGAVAFSLESPHEGGPALRLYHSSEEAHTAATRLREGSAYDLGADFDWVGDIWQGIQSGVLGVKTVLVNVAEKFSQVTVLLADGAEMVFTAAWDRLKGAAQAVQATFVWVEAKIDQVIDWLSWAFDFKDIVDTANALESVFVQLPALASEAIDLRQGCSLGRHEGLGEEGRGGLRQHPGCLRVTNFTQFSQDPQSSCPRSVSRRRRCCTAGMPTGCWTSTPVPPARRVTTSPRTRSGGPSAVAGGHRQGGEACRPGRLCSRSGNRCRPTSQARSTASDPSTVLSASIVAVAGRVRRGLGRRHVDFVAGRSRFHRADRVA